MLTDMMADFGERLEFVHNSLPKSNTIQSIDKADVHRICSGQVIICLATAVKELIENSLDAGSTSIEIRLKEHGSDLIEVQDNGCGVEERDFQLLTLKHCTSKLENFDDLTEVRTFGFRGEALSSLCALSKVTVITRHKNASIGTKLDYDHNGTIITQVPCSRQVGTTIVLQNLFSTLPVRHKEFLRNIKKEYTKMLNLMYAYCLISTSTRILCTNITANNKSVVAVTNGTNLKENISMLFGPKQMTSVIEIRQHDILNDVLQELNLKDELCKADVFRINGFISNCQSGCGRGSPDRQFYYINGRPCDLSKVSRVINDIYRSFNHHQCPFVLLNITTARETVDVNVTPDKRLIMIENENLLLAIIKSSLLVIFKSENSVLYSLQPCLESPSSSDESKVTSVPVKLATAISKMELHSPKTNGTVNFNGTCSFSVWQSASKKKTSVQESPRPKKQRKLNFNKESLSELNDDAEINSVLTLNSESTSDITTILESRNVEYSELPRDSTEVCAKDEKLSDEDIEVESRLEDYSFECIMDSSVATQRTQRAYREIPFSMNALRAALKTSHEDKKVINRKFRAKIQPEDNKTAEDELKKQLNQHEFIKMEIIGQFNLGFIIAKLGSDVFIIDQHASDEKYNYESLNKTTVLETQKLISPQLLELSAMNESILIDNWETFRKNGFIFEVEENEEMGAGKNRVKLVAVPVSKNWIFGKDDIDEMLYMLGDDNTGFMCRPSRIQQMLASRACRKSVMIGTALTHLDMKKVIEHMGEMDQPWNCPHGRPTIRHLLNLDIIDRSLEETVEV